MLGFSGDLRHYQAAAQIIKEFGFTSIKLITNNPHKIDEMEKQGITVERIPTPIFINHHNENYLQTKKKEFGHLLG
jgi:3,4-dihydroxy 2-butanone 4-phosphate synthase/GTP cyclohydrolase II